MTNRDILRASAGSPSFQAFFQVLPRYRYRSSTPCIPSSPTLSYQCLTYAHECDTYRLPMDDTYFDLRGSMVPFERFSSGRRLERPESGAAQPPPPQTSLDEPKRTTEFSIRNSIQPTAESETSDHALRAGMKNPEDRVYKYSVQTLHCTALASHSASPKPLTIFHSDKFWLVRTCTWTQNLTGQLRENVAFWRLRIPKRSIRSTLSSGC